MYNHLEPWAPIVHVILAPLFIKNLYHHTWDTLPTTALAVGDASVKPFNVVAPSVPLRSQL